MSTADSVLWIHTFALIAIAYAMWRVIKMVTGRFDSLDREIREIWPRLRKDKQ